MRRLAATAAVALLLGGCAASGSSGRGESADEPAATTTTTTTTSAATAPPTTIDRTGREITWDDVVQVASAQHGTVARSVNAYDQGSDRSLVPEFETELRFDGVRGLADARIVFPPSLDFPGGETIELVFFRGRTLMRSDSITGDCDEAWLELGGIVDAQGGSGRMAGIAGLVTDLGYVGKVPMAPFDRVVAAEPVVGDGPPARVVFPFELPASMLVADSGRAEAPGHWAELDATSVQAQVVLTPTGLELEASAPVRDLLTPDQVGAMPPGTDGVEMVGTWELTPSSEPLGLDVPTDIVTTGDECVDL